MCFSILFLSFVRRFHVRKSCILVREQVMAVLNTSRVVCIGDTRERVFFLINFCISLRRDSCWTSSRVTESLPNALGAIDSEEESPERQNTRQQCQKRRAVFSSRHRRRRRLFPSFVKKNDRRDKKCGESF